MLKTNSKQARENVMLYIRQDVDYLREQYQEYNPVMFGGYDLDNDSDLCSMIYKIFNIECADNDPFMSEFDRFDRWSQGLPLAQLFTFYVHSAVNDLGDILEETQEERNKYSESQAENLLLYLIFKEIDRRRDKDDD